MDFNPRIFIGVLVCLGLLGFGIYRLVFGTFFEPLDQPGAEVEDYIEVIELPELPEGNLSFGDIGLSEFSGAGDSEQREAVGGAQESPAPAPGSCWVYCRDAAICPFLVEFNPTCEVVFVSSEVSR